MVDKELISFLAFQRRLLCLPEPNLECVQISVSLKRFLKLL